MNTSVTEADTSAAPQPAQEQGAASQNPQSDNAAAPAAKKRTRGGRRHARSGQGNGKTGHGDGNAAPVAARQAVPSASRRQPHPVVTQLQALYPELFGEQPKPLKRGIFQDLEAAQAGVFEAADLKVALGLHTRSTRYLQAVAQGMPRHDLAGQVVEKMAPEHVFHALVEVFRRRKPRDGEDLQAKLRRRMVQAFEASGLTREAYVDLVRGRDDATNALLDEALADVAARQARDEALLRAFDASGAASVEAFADMYGMPSRQVEQSLERARRARA